LYFIYKRKINVSDYSYTITIKVVMDVLFLNSMIKIYNNYYSKQKNDSKRIQRENQKTGVRCGLQEVFFFQLKMFKLNSVA